MEKVVYQRDLMVASTMPWKFDASIGVRAGKRRPIEDRSLVLLRNIAGNTSAILQLAQFHLFHSYPDITEKFTRSLKSKKDPDSDTLELFREHSLQSAIVFSNASIEYLQIMMMVAFTDFSDVMQLAPKLKVRNKMTKDGLAEHDWDVALYSVLQSQFDTWWGKTSLMLPVWLDKAYHRLEADNYSLKTTYQANQLKHYSYATFKRTNKRNIMRQDFAITDSIDVFYSGPLKGMAIGSRGNILELDPTAKFVEDYQDASIKLFNRLIGSMRFRQDN